MDILKDSDPEVFDAIRRRGAAPARRARADRLGELHQRGGDGGGGLGPDEQVRRGAARRSATTAAASSSTGPSGWRSTASRNCSAPSTPTSSPTPAPRPTRRSTSPRSRSATRVLAMDLAQGGHLTHGMKLNFSGRWYPTVGYGVDPKTERIDFDNLAAPGPRAQAEADPGRRQRL